MLDDLSPYRTAGLVVASSLFWLEYWDMKDRKRPEPRSRLFAAFGLGVAAVAPALLAYWGLSLAGVPTLPGGSAGRVLAVCLGVVGPIEEAAKMSVALLLVFRWKTFDERVDGVIYAAAISLGFAAAENAFWLPGLGTGDALVRSLCSPLVHTLFGAVWGAGTAHALLDVRGRGARVLWILGSYVAASLVHGVYDAVLMLTPYPHVIAAVVLLLWIGVITTIRRAALRDDRFLGPAYRR